MCREYRTKWVRCVDQKWLDNGACRVVTPYIQNEAPYPTLLLILLKVTDFPDISILFIIK